MLLLCGLAPLRETNLFADSIDTTKSPPDLSFLIPLHNYKCESL